MVKIECEGLDFVPEQGAALLVGNHRSDMDPFIVASRVQRFVSWIAAEYTERIPIFKNLSRATGVIPMDIDGNVSVSSIKRIMAVLRKGELLGIFPEGHDYLLRNDFSAPLADFHSGFAIFAIRTRAPVVPFILMPLDESLETMPVPPSVRTMMGMPDDVSAIPHRINYRHVKLIFAPPVPYALFKDLPEAEAIQYIVQTTRERMQAIQLQHGMLLPELA